jgi:hypothetical protein
MLKIGKETWDKYKACEKREREPRERQYRKLTKKSLEKQKKEKWKDGHINTPLPDLDPAPTSLWSTFIAMLMIFEKEKEKESASASELEKHQKDSKTSTDDFFKI